MGFAYCESLNLALSIGLIFIYCLCFWQPLTCGVKKLVKTLWLKYCGTWWGTLASIGNSSITVEALSSWYQAWERLRLSYWKRNENDKIIGLISVPPPNPEQSEDLTDFSIFAERTVFPMKGKGFFGGSVNNVNYFFLVFKYLSSHF